jgi:SAM-dependent methyltransferase
VTIAAMEGDSAVWPTELHHACPHCRTPLDLPRGRDAACRACGFVARLERGVYRFITATDPPSDWQATYDRVATGLLEDTPSGLLYRSPVAHRLRTYRLLCGLVPEGTRILDAGCANGVFAKLLFGGRELVGFDFSFEMCVQARAGGMLAHQADALALPFADAQFDLVCVAGLLEHIAALEEMLGELARVCRPGGRVVLGTGNRSSLARRMMRLVRRVKPAPLSVMRRPVIMRTLDEVLAAARAAALAPELVVWTHFPLPWQRASASPSTLLAPLASNVYVRLIKQPRG